MWYSCVHAGEYVNRRSYLTDENRIRKASTRKAGCGWSASAKRELAAEGDRWVVQVSIGTHTHAPSELTAYPSARQLTVDEKGIVRDMSVAGAPPKTILATLNGQRKSTGSGAVEVIGRDVYNARNALRVDELQGRTPVEALLDDLQTRNVWHRVKRDTEGRVSHLLFIPNETSSFLREFHTTLLMDCTYKTNRCGDCHNVLH